MVLANPHSESPVHVTSEHYTTPSPVRKPKPEQVSAIMDSIRQTSLGDMSTPANSEEADDIDENSNEPGDDPESDEEAESPEHEEDESEQDSDYEHYGTAKYKL